MHKYLEILPGGRFVILLFAGIFLAILYFVFTTRALGLLDLFLLALFVVILIYLLKDQYQKPRVMSFEKLLFAGDIRSIPVLESKKLIALSTTHLKGNLPSGKFSIDLDDVKSLKRLPQSRRDEFFNNSTLLIVHLEESALIAGNKIWIERIYDSIITHPTIKALMLKTKEGHSLKSTAK